MRRHFSDKALVISATIIGILLVCAAWIMAKDPFEFVMSPLFARSIQKQFVSRVQSQLKSHPRQDPWGLGQVKSCVFKMSMFRASATKSWGKTRTSKSST